MTPSRSRSVHALPIGIAVSILCVALAARQPSAQPPQPEKPTSAATPTDAAKTVTDEALFLDLMENHWAKIFPKGDRNVGGPQFFKYIYEQLATNHDLFKRYSRFYCGVSGAIVDPGYQQRFDLVKIKDSEGHCVIGKYYRCCWPCSCDIMKYARVEKATLRLPKDPGGKEETYWVLTIGDPCYRCDSTPCADLPPEVTTYACKDKVTSNGLRVSDGRLTSGKSGRLVFALLHDAAPADETSDEVKANLMTRCTGRINASPEELKEMGGMGNIFVDVARINAGETFTNTFDDLCD